MRATPHDEIPRFIETLDAHPGIEALFGARVQLLGRTIERRASRHYLGRVSATAISLVLGLAIYDTQCGAKLFRASVACKALFAEPFHSRWLFDVEIIFLFAWASVFRDLGWYGVGAVAIFTLLIAETLGYVWKRGALDWNEPRRARYRTEAKPVLEDEVA